MDRELVMTKEDLEFLKQYRFGPVWDGNVASKQSRDRLVKLGFIDRDSGFQFLNKAGVYVLVEHGFLTPNTWQERRV